MRIPMYVCGCGAHDCFYCMAVARVFCFVCLKMTDPNRTHTHAYNAIIYRGGGRSARRSQHQHHRRRRHHRSRRRSAPRPPGASSRARAAAAAVATAAARSRSWRRRACRGWCRSCGSSRRGTLRWVGAFASCIYMRLSNCAMKERLRFSMRSTIQPDPAPHPPTYIQHNKYTGDGRARLREALVGRRRGQGRAAAARAGYVVGWDGMDGFLWGLVAGLCRHTYVPAHDHPTQPNHNHKSQPLHTIQT